LEYFACEKPVVATHTEAIPEVVELEKRGLGITVPGEDAEALAEAILRLLEDERLRRQLGRGGRAYVEQERSWKAVAQKSLNIMHALRGSA
jgi:glycosyltransferase involved in cell wall biosynthesis